jgi:glycosyltransferase involved in cell wall biosynthesis
MSAPEVSVVVPCYNGGRFLERLLASLAHQSFRSFETIIVDDGSTDPDTSERLGRMAAEVRVVRQPNRGLPSARNTGFREASAALVLPLDCDDALEPEFVQKTVHALQQNSDGTAFAFTHMRVTGQLSGLVPRHFNRFDQLFLNQLPYCMLIRKAAWQAVGGYDETMRDGYEDWEFNIRLAAAGFDGVEIPEPLFIYFVADEGMFMSRSAVQHSAIWRGIRRKHAPLYTWAELRRCRAESQPGRITKTTALGLLALAKALPDRWFGQLYRLRLRAAHRRRGLCASADAKHALPQDTDVGDALSHRYPASEIKD